MESEINNRAFAFNHSQIERQLKVLERIGYSKPKYTIGIDTYDKEKLAYCLTKEHNGDLEILLCKTLSDKKEFEVTIETLAKCFDAEIYRNSK